ncbi:MAG: hypothetical protein AAGD96_35630, partial [Chloroflexota bacterium]
MRNLVGVFSFSPPSENGQIDNDVTGFTTIADQGGEKIKTSTTNHLRGVPISGQRPHRIGTLSQ